MSISDETPSRYDTVRLGDTVKLLDKQHDALNAVVDIIQKKKELDERYADDLEALMHPFENLTIEPSAEGLLQPFLTFLAGEIDLRRKSDHIIAEHLASFILPKRPSLSDANPVPVEELIEELHESTKHHKKCFRIANHAIPKLQTWYEQLDHKIASRDVTAGISDFKMLSEELQYRRGIWRQHHASSKLRGWCKYILPNLLETHHRHVEQVSKLAKAISAEYRALTTDIAMRASALLEGFTALSPLPIAALGRLMAEKESRNSEIQPAVYHNYMTNGAVSSFFLGSNSLAISLLGNHMEGLNVLRTPRQDGKALPIKTANILKTCFVIEGEGIDAFNYKKVLADHGRDVLLALAFLEFANVDPLFPISEETTRQFSGGLPRKFMQQVMSEAEEGMIHSLVPINMELIRNLLIEYGISDVCEILAGNNTSRRILLDIARKWDFDKHCPLPEGETRPRAECPAIIRLF